MAVVPVKSGMVGEVYSGMPHGSLAKLSENVYQLEIAGMIGVNLEGKLEGNDRIHQLPQTTSNIFHILEEVEMEYEDITKIIIRYTKKVKGNLEESFTNLFSPVNYPLACYQVQSLPRDAVVQVDLTAVGDVNDKYKAMFDSKGPSQGSIGKD